MVLSLYSLITFEDLVHSNLLRPLRANDPNIFYTGDNYSKRSHLSLDLGQVCMPHCRKDRSESTVQR